MKKLYILILIIFSFNMARAQQNSFNFSVNIHEIINTGMSYIKMGHTNNLFSSFVPSFDLYKNISFSSLIPTSIFGRGLMTVFGFYAITALIEKVKHDYDELAWRKQCYVKRSNALIDANAFLNFENYQKNMNLTLNEIESNGFIAEQQLKELKKIEKVILLDNENKIDELLTQIQSKLEEIKKEKEEQQKKKNEENETTLQKAIDQLKLDQLLNKNVEKDPFIICNDNNSILLDA